MNSKLLTISILLTVLTFSHQNIFAENIFSDNFNVTGSGDVNYNFDESGRQSGSASELLYTLNGGGAYVTNAGPYAGKCVLNPSAAITPDHNFNESGDFTIEYELTRTDDPAASNNWNSICFGNNLGNIWPWQAEPGVSLVFENQGSYSFWENGTQTSSFYFSGLSWSNPVIKVKFVVSQGGFPPTQDARIALFLNDKPYPLSSANGNKFVYIYKGGFSNNYFTILSWLTPEIIDNLKVSTPSGNLISTAAWTDDADSGISSSNFYTHKVNLAVPTNLEVNVNGVTFTGAGTNNTATDMHGENWELRTETPNGLFLAFDLLAALGQSKNIAPESLFLATNVLFNGVDSGGLTLSGLTPNQNYMLTLYSSEFDYLSPNGRSNYFATSDGGVITMANQSEFGANNGQILQYQYTASSSNFSISATPVAGSAPIAWFAFSNELLPPSSPENVSASQGKFTDKIQVIWDEVSVADGYSIFRADTNDFSSATELQIGIITNLFDDSTVTIAQDYFYWVSASNTVGSGSVSSSALGFTKSNPPSKPENLSPKDYLSVTSTVIFSASSYNDTSGYIFSESQWQVSSAADFSSISWDSGTILPTETYAPPKSELSTGTNFWRVKYKNNRNTWSDYSDGTSFIYTPGAGQVGMFWDSFNVAGLGNINNGYYNSGRQFGGISPLSYNFYGSTEVGTSSQNPGKLTLGINSSFSPNYDFTKSGSFKIEFDAQIHNFDGENGWISISFGKTNQTDMFPVSSAGASAIFSTDGTFQAFDGVKQIAAKALTFPKNTPVHLIATVSTETFDEGDPAVFSAFVNGIPMPVYVPNPGLISNSYAYTINNGLDKNFISVYNFNGSGTNSSIVDNFIINESPNVITSYQWSSDSDVRVGDNPDYITTHLINLDDDDDANFNGITFKGSGYNPGGYVNGDPNITTNNWALWSAGDWVGLHNVEPTNTFGGVTESWKLARHFGYANSGALALQLSGLTPYSSNTLSIFGVGFESSGRACYFSSSYGGAIETVELNEYGLGGGIIVEYDYIASAEGTFTLAMSPQIKDLPVGFHLSAFANEETGLPEPISVIGYLLSAIGMFLFRAKK